MHIQQKCGAFCVLSGVCVVPSPLASVVAHGGVRIPTSYYRISTGHNRRILKLKVVPRENSVKCDLKAVATLYFRPENARCPSPHALTGLAAWAATL